MCNVGLNEFCFFNGRIVHAGYTWPENEKKWFPALHVHIETIHIKRVLNKVLTDTRNHGLMPQHYKFLTSEQRKEVQTQVRSSQAALIASGNEAADTACSLLMELHKQVLPALTKAKGRLHHNTKTKVSKEINKAIAAMKEYQSQK